MKEVQSTQTEAWKRLLAFALNSLSLPCCEREYQIESYTRLLSWGTLLPQASPPLQ
jgi:hypothetical protein